MRLKIQSLGASLNSEPLNLYDYPRYYEIAFSYRDIGKEVDVMEECIRRFSKIPVHRF